MSVLFKRPSNEGGLESRIAELSARRGRFDPGGPAGTPIAGPADGPVPNVGPASGAEIVRVNTAPQARESRSAAPEQIVAAREELTARLNAEIRPERRAQLSRADLAKLAAVHAYFVRNSIEANPLARRDLVTEVMQTLLPTAPAAAPEAATRKNPHRAAIEAAKAQIQPLVLEHMDVAAAAEMPRAAFEAQLTGWVKELLAETKIQLNFVEQRELVDSLIADMLGLGPLEPLIADETVNDIMVNGPKQVYVERRGKLELTDVQFRDDAHLMNVATKIVTRVGRRIDEARPLGDAPPPRR